MMKWELQPAGERCPVEALSQCSAPLCVLAVSHGSAEQVTRAAFPPQVISRRSFHGILSVCGLDWISHVDAR